MVGPYVAEVTPLSASENVGLPVVPFALEMLTPVEAVRVRPNDCAPFCATTPTTKVPAFATAVFN